MPGISRRQAGSRPAFSLREAIRRLEGHYGTIAPVAPSEPFALLLWEYVAYLADDAKRAAAFAGLRKAVGPRPDQIAAAPMPLLESLCRKGGGIAVRTRAERMRLAAHRVRDRFGGSLRGVLARPYAEARRVLKSFPAIGPPGADRILLLTGAQKVLALDSNALRVLLRLGVGEEKKSYAATYGSAQTAAMHALPRSLKALQKASSLLRRHGQEICRRAQPRCPACPLQRVCVSALAEADSPRKGTP